MLILLKKLGMRSGKGAAMLLVAVIAVFGVATVWIVSELQRYAEQRVARKHRDD